MTNEELFDIWAAEDALWSAWVKPVLFARQPPAIAASSLEEWRNVDTAWAPRLHEKTALVIDLPGPLSMLTGLAAAARGYRPVPLYNTSAGPSAVIPMEPILELLAQAAPYLAGLFLPRDAPPSFLLDSLRLRGNATPLPGSFDNRWLVFPQDFPSATYLRSHGVHSVLLVQVQAGQPQSDLAHVLLRWQQAGLLLNTVVPGAHAAPQPLPIQRPSMFRWALHRFFAGFGLRRNATGGFGAVVPLASSSSG